MKFFKRKADRSKRKEKVDDEKTISSRSGGESLRGLLQLQTDVVESDAVKGGASEPTKLDTETASLHNLYHTQNSTLTEYTNNRTYNPTVTFDPACDKGTVKSDTQERRTTSKIEDELHMEEYKKIPTLESVKLPRGGVSVDTEAVGRIQVSYLIVFFSLFVHTKVFRSSTPFFSLEILTEIRFLIFLSF